MAGGYDHVREESSGFSPSDLHAHAERSIEALRRRLLDLKTSNVLLNIRLGGRSYVRIIDEVPEQILEELSAGRSFELCPVPQPSIADGGDDARVDVIAAARAAGLDPSYELPEPAVAPLKKHSDDLIQTLLLPRDLDAVLEKLRRRSNTLLQELGVPTLHIAFGSLEWFDADSSDRAMHAPLILVQIQLSRELKGGRYRYRIRCEPETDPQTNGTLRIKLRRDFGLDLPDLGEGNDLGGYLRAVAAVVEGEKRWRVHRHVTVGIFRFERLVMSEDLGATDWSPTDHPLIRRLLGVIPDPSEPSVDVQDLDAPEFEARAPLLVTDADGTQTMAVADALAGHNLVVRGPPGTGKSQTITNLIAAALAQGKTVLFVAEKMAALEVVRKRLEDAQLGEFAIELHSTKASKRDVLDHVQRRLDVAPELDTTRTLAEKVQTLRHTRKELNDYLRAIHSPFGAGGASIFQILWKQQTLSGPVAATWFGVLSQIRVAGVIEMTAEQLSIEMEALRMFRLRRAEMRPAARGGHPWDDFFERYDIDLVLEDSLLGQIQQWLDALLALARDARSMLAAGTQLTLGRVRAAAHGALALERPAPAVVELADALHTPALRDGATRLLPVVRALVEADTLVSTTGFAWDTLGTRLGAIRRLLAVAESFRIENEDLIGLQARFEMDARAFGDLEAKAARLRRVCALLGWRADPLDPSVARALLHLADIVRNAGKDALMMRSDALVREKPPGVMARFADRVGELQSRAVDADGWASGWRKQDPQVLRNAALVLREAGIWERWWGAKYRAVRRRALTLLRGARLEREEMAAKLEQCAEILEEGKAAHDDEMMRKLMPQGFDWSTVDVDLVCAVDAWATEVRRTTATLDDATGLVRDAAFHAPNETLTVVVETVAPLRDDLMRVLNDWPRCDLGAFAADRRAHAEEALEAVASLSDAGIKLTSTTESLGLLLRLAPQRDEWARVVASHRAVVEALGCHWTQVLRDPSDLDRALVWMSTTERAARDLGLNVAVSASWSSWLDGMQQRAAGVGRALQAESTAREAAASMGVAVEGIFRRAGSDVEATINILSGAVAARAALRGWLLYLRSRAGAAQHARLKLVVNAADQLDDDLVGLEEGYEWLIHRELVHEAGRRYPALEGDAWSGDHLARTRSRFAQLDREVLTIQQREIRSRLLARAVPSGSSTGPRAHWTDLALVKHEVAKQKRHISIRALVSRGRGALMALTPCFMMSPLSVAQFLPRIAGMFDLLVIDEASQMRPEDAVGALARAKQIVVVGDENQLPPMAFFDSTQEDDLAENDPRLDERIESILDWSRSAFSRTRELLWHYRSRHESLIAFSNDRFYDGRLLVFPSPATPGATHGVRLCEVAGNYSSSRNESEARAVVKAATAFMNEHPSRTLGIVAMNRPQAELIEQLLDDEIRRSGDDGYREHWAHTLSPFFVKNLESVQGDERDAIFVSLTYGAAAPGTPVLQRFGPLNGDDGHRRLNVLFTRAKEQLTVFSSMKPSDIRVDAATKRGVRTLRDYIEYAARGGQLLASGAVRGRAGYDSPFEESVARILQAEGFEMEPQVGVQGFFIDLGVRHDSYSAGFICGVECDGAAYHSTRSARDRDRIRQSVLEGLGWRIIRVWSTDWFRSPAEARKKLIREVSAALDSARRGKAS